VNKPDVEAPIPGCKPKLDINCKLVPQIWLVDWSVVSVVIQEYVVEYTVYIHRVYSISNNRSVSLDSYKLLNFYSLYFATI